MAHHQRYHQFVRNKNGVSDRNDVKDNEESKTLLFDFGNSTSYYRRTTPKLLFFYFLFIFLFLSCCLILRPQLFSLYAFAVGNDGLVDVPICSSVASGTICCDRSNIHSDICYMKGDIRTQSASSSIVLYSSNNINNGGIEMEEIQHERIKPYPRKGRKSVMDTIEELHLVVKRPTLGNTDECQVKHSAPAVVFSTGGYTKNAYHQFNDGIIPLYITSQHLNKEVVIVLLEYQEWWMTKYASLLSQLTNYPVVDYNGDNRTHCFPEAIVGLRFHDVLTIDSSQMQDRTSIRDFQMLLDRSFWPRTEGLVQEAQLKPGVKLNHSKKPKLVIISRNGSRAMTNEDAMVEMAKQIGFEVEVLKPNSTTKLATIYRSLNSCDVMIGVHGAAMTHILFMRPGSIFIQVIPFGTDKAAQICYGDPAMKLGLKYINYNILLRESSLYGSYSQDDPILKDPDSVNAKGWEFTKKFYLDRQSVNLELGRFRESLVRAYGYVLQRHPRTRHLRCYRTPPDFSFLGSYQSCREFLTPFSIVNGSSVVDTY